MVTVGGSGIRIQGEAKSFDYLCFFIQHIFVEDLLCMVIEQMNMRDTKEGRV